MDSSDLQSLFDTLSASRVLAALALLLATWAALRLLDRLVLEAEKRFSRYRLLWRRALPVLHVVVWAAVAWIVVARVLEPPRETLITVLASVGLAVGLAAQGLVKSLIAGVFLVVEQPFQVGDMVRLGEHRGEVVFIGLRSFRLRTFDDDLVTLPNALLLEQPLANATAGSLHEQVAVEFTLPASVDATRIKRLAEAAASCSPYVHLAKPIVVLVEDAFAGTLLTRFRVKAYVADLRFERLFASDVVERIKRELLRLEIVTPELLRELALASRPAMA